MRGIFPRPVKTEALDGFGDGIGYRKRVADNALLILLDPPRQSLFHFEQGANQRRRIAAIHMHRIEAAGAQMAGEGVQALLGTQLGALFDPSAIGDHDRQSGAAVLGTPPAGDPVTAALFLGGAIGEKRHQCLAGQRHVGVLQFGEAQIAALDYAAGGKGVYMAAQGRGRPAIGQLRIAVEVPQQLLQAGIPGIARSLFGVQVAGQNVDCINGGDAVPLAHQPAPGLSGQAAQRKVGRVGRDHIQGTAGVALGSGLEVLRGQRGTVGVAALGIGHMHHQPHSGAGQMVQGSQYLVDAADVSLLARLL